MVNWFKNEFGFPERSEAQKMGSTAEEVFAQEAGGFTLAILPGEDLSDANPFVDIPVITGLGFTRNALIARTANALIEKSLRNRSTGRVRMPTLQRPALSESQS